MTLYYWNIRARAHFANVIAAYAGQPLQWERQFEWPGTLKAKSPFGQVPYFEDGDVHLGQSMAIYRYLARKLKLEGDSLADFGLSEMLIEESSDIYNLMAKAQYSEAKIAAFEKFFSEQLPSHLSNLEKLFKGPQFCPRVLSGDLAIFTILDIIVNLEPKALDTHGKLKAFYQKIAENPGVKALLASNINNYFTPKVAPESSSSSSSSSPVKVVEKLYAAYNAGDVATVVGQCHPQVEWRVIGYGSLLSGNWPGQQSVMAFFTTVLGAYDLVDKISYKILGADASQGFVAVEYTWPGVNRKTGKAVTQTVGHHWWIDSKGFISKFHCYIDTLSFHEAERD
jgi:glutathione S-transferase/ketosteroid isomerase-like protein